MKSDYTHLVLVLDRSGSMSSVQNDIIGGFNRYIADQAKFSGRCTVTLVQFDTEYETIYGGVDIKNVVPRDTANYVPRGGTALLDAACRAIDEAGLFLSALPEAERPERVACVILTDGQENSSREQKKADLIRRIETQSKGFKWVFAYIGSDMATFADAGCLGLAAASTHQYQHNAKGVADAFQSLQCATNLYRSGQNQQLNVGGLGGP